MSSKNAVYNGLQPLKGEVETGDDNCMAVTGGWKFECHQSEGLLVGGDMTPVT